MDILHDELDIDGLLVLSNSTLILERESEAIGLVLLWGLYILRTGALKQEIVADNSPTEDVNRAYLLFELPDLNGKAWGGKFSDKLIVSAPIDSELEQYAQHIYVETPRLPTEVIKEWVFGWLLGCGLLFF